MNRMETRNLNEIIHQISYFPKKRLGVFKNLTDRERGFVVLRLSKHLRYEIVSKLEKDELISMLEYLDTDEATDILQLFPEKKREPIIEKLNKEMRSGVSLLLQFDPGTAAGLMSIDYIQVDSTDSITSVAKQVEVHEKRTGKLPAILVMDSKGLAGYVPGHVLGIRHPADQIIKYAKKARVIDHKANTREVLELFREHPHDKVVVLGERGNVMGIIYSDDILRVLDERGIISLWFCRCACGGIGF